MKWIDKIMTNLFRGKTVQEEKAVSYEHEKIIATINQVKDIVENDIKDITERIARSSRGNT